MDTNQMHDQSKTGPSSFQRVAKDVLDLCELQMQLLSVDSQEARRKLTTAIACGAIASVLAFSSLIVTMIGGGFLLDELTDLSTGASLLIVSLSVAALSGVLVWVAVSAIRHAADAMSETKSEFAENLRWLKATFITPETSPRHQIRGESFDHDPSPRSRPQNWNGSNVSDHEPTLDRR